MANDWVLVTGGSGFIGSHIATALVEQGRRVRVLDNFSTSSPANLNHIRGDIDLLEGDLRNEDNVRAAPGACSSVARWVLPPRVRTFL